MCCVHHETPFNVPPMFRYHVTEFRFIFFTKAADMAEANIYQFSFCKLTSSTFALILSTWYKNMMELIYKKMVDIYRQGTACHQYMQHVIVRADDLQGKKTVEKAPIKLNKNHEERNYFFRWRTSNLLLIFAIGRRQGDNACHVKQANKQPRKNWLEGHRSFHHPNNHTEREMLWSHAKGK